MYSKSFLQPSSFEISNGIWPKSIPLWMSGLYVALFIIRPWEQLVPALGTIYFERIYAICMIAVVCFSSKKQFRFKFQGLVICMFVFALSVSALLALNMAMAISELYEYFTLVVFYFVLTSVIRSAYDMFFIVICYEFSMFIYLFKSQWEFFINGQHRYDMGVVRLTGIENSFGGPNSLAMSIVVSLPIALFLWRYRDQICDAWPPLYSKAFSWILRVYFLLSISSIILTNSRSGMLSFVVFVMLSVLHSGNTLRFLKYSVLGVLVLGIVWAFMPQENRTRFETIWNPEAGPENAQESAVGRIEGFHAGVVMFERFPVAGVGIGNFLAYRVAKVDQVPLNAHNLLGQVLGETGLVGVSAFVLLLLTILGNCRAARLVLKGIRGGEGSIFAGLSAAIRNAVILLLFEGFFGHNLLRFNWLWLAAFAMINLEQAQSVVANKVYEE